MGICCLNADNQLPEILTYNRNIIIRVKEKDLRKKVVCIEDVNFQVPLPVQQNVEKFILEKTELLITTCVLPSVDPRGTLSKECQDGYCWSFDSNTLFLALFDGHGTEGKSIVSACKEFMPAYFKQNLPNFQEAPEQALVSLVHDCDQKVTQEFKCDLSGCTALLLLITEQGFHIASVGDSRAVLGTIPPTNTPEERVLITNNPYSRLIEPVREIRSLALSIDQKPNIESEYRRIIESGGLVQKITTAYGNTVGPFRVWKPATPYPGLSMSRSIGDAIGKTIGVISTPIYHFFPYHKFRDQFLVVASDGLWSVFENIEAVNFVEKFRRKSQKEAGEEYPASFGNCTVARLLAEEARFRWLGLCEEDDCVIDDISVVVVEISPLEIFSGDAGSGGKRKPAVAECLVNVEDCAEFKSGVLRGDIFRGSFVPGPDVSKYAFNTGRLYSI